MMKRHTVLAMTCATFFFSFSRLINPLLTPVGIVLFIAHFIILYFNAYLFFYFLLKEEDWR